MTFRIQTSVNWMAVTFKLSGQLDGKTVNELERLFGVYGPKRKVALDLKDVGLIHRETLKFLATCKSNGMELKNCPAYVREWMLREEHNGEQVEGGKACHN